MSYSDWNMFSSVWLAPPPRDMLMTLAPPRRHLLAALARLPPPQVPESLKTLTMYSSAPPGSTPTTPRVLFIALMVPATWVPWPLPSEFHVPTLPSVVPVIVIPAKSLWPMWMPESMMQILMPEPSGALVSTVPSRFLSHTSRAWNWSMFHGTTCCISRCSGTGSTSATLAWLFRPAAAWAGRFTTKVSMSFRYEVISPPTPRRLASVSACRPRAWRM